MEVYSWDTVQATILTQAEVAHSPIPEAFFDRNNFFLPKGLGCQLRFFEGMNEHNPVSFQVIIELICDIRNL